MIPGPAGEPAAVNACVNALAQSIAQLPGGHYRLNDKGAPERITNSALSRILRSPNGYQTRSDFMINLVCDLQFVGNAYAFAQRNNRQEVTALHLMPARQCAPYVDMETQAIFYGLGRNPLVGDLDYLVPQRDVLHVRGRCYPGQPLRGVPPLEWAISARMANTAITDAQAAFFTNAAQPSGVLSTDQLLTKDQMERLREAWRAHAAGVRRGDVPVLGGALKWVPMSLSSQDAQMIEAFSMTVADIARAFGVPLTIIGEVTRGRQSFANVEQLIGLWLAQGLGFWVEHIEVAFDKFFALPDGEYTELDTDALLRTALKERIDALTAGITGGLYAPNEARAKEGLGAVAFGDEPRVQAQVVPLSQVDKQPAAPSAPAPGNPVNPANDNPPGADAPPADAPAADAKKFADALAVQGAAVAATVRADVAADMRAAFDGFVAALPAPAPAVDDAQLAQALQAHGDAVAANVRAIVSDAIATLPALVAPPALTPTADDWAARLRSAKGRAAHANA
jgi:HK97 family phage portal protein